MKSIRNFAIISHVDHGKSTLADRFLEITNTIDTRKMRSQFLDSMDLEREKGITIKLKPVRMKYSLNGKLYILNLIDTPGHVDFSYEVSRSLAACEGAVLLVDATCGIQAQTVSNLHKARLLNLKIIPAINKIDSHLAKIDQTKENMKALFGFTENEIHLISGKEGTNVENLLNSVVKEVPPPSDTDNAPFRALIFDSFYDTHLGVVANVKVVDGSLTNAREQSKIRFYHSGCVSNISDLGYFIPKMKSSPSLGCGEVGFIATGLKDINLVRVGDTVTLESEFEKNKIEPLSGYRKPKPVVFLSLFPTRSMDFDSLKKALGKLKLNDSALSFSAENAGSLGLGFRCGFLGLLHAEITQERLEREYGVSVFAATPSVSYKIILKDKRALYINSAGDFPNPSQIEIISEPYSKVTIFTPFSYVGRVMELCDKKRAVYKAMETLGNNGFSSVQITYEIPLLELISGFYDELKSISSGYASLDYELTGYKEVNVVCMDILLASEKVHALSRLVRKEDAFVIGRNLVKKLKELLPKEQFAVSIQAAIGNKIIARETLSAAKKNVLEGIYGGHRERKDKLLDRQREGKKRLKRFGRVSLPQTIFWELMK